MTLTPSLYWLTRSAAQAPCDNAWLSPRERRILAGKRIVKRRADWRLGRWTAKSALMALEATGGRLRMTDIEIRAGDDVAPVAFVHGTRLGAEISISHSGGLGMCAIAPASLAAGCDVETVEPRSDGLARDFFSVEERSLVSETPADRRAFMTTLIWSAKESVLKALREGLRRDTRSVVVRIGKSQRQGAWHLFTATCTETLRDFHGWWRLREGRVYCLAADAPTATPVCLDSALTSQVVDCPSAARSLPSGCRSHRGS